MSSRRAVLYNAGEKLEPMEVTEFDVEEETGTRVPVKSDPGGGGHPQPDSSPLKVLVPSLRQRER